MIDPQSEPGVPDAEAWRLFGFRIPLAADQHQRGRDGGFKDAEEETRGEEGAVSVGRGGAGRGDAPEDEIGGEPFGSRDFLEEDCLKDELIAVLG